MAALLLAATVARAQYYSWGADAASLRWRTIRTPDVQVIFPDTAGAIARRTLHFIEAAQPSIGYGFRHGPLKIPFVMHPENFRSNGLVMWLPKRVEFLTSPAIDSYSMPWYKQLVAHEYRHAVQYNNLNRGVIKGLSYVLGQQGSTVGLLLLPIWLIEGDAVQMETQMSSFGRALQPSFTMEYRALGDAVRSRRNIDRWFCGSYRTNVPDHYHLGYQIAAYADTRYRENIWDKVAWYGARNPYMIFTTSIALKKFYRTDVGTLFAETFDGLNYYWNALPARRNSSRYLSAEPVESYTTYAFPLAVDAQRVLALKTDYDRPTRFVTIDTESGRERAVAYTGSVSTRPAYADGRVWWTEYRRSTLFEQRVNSQLCYMDLDRGKPKAVRGRRHALYPTPTDRGLAWVEYSPDGRFAVTGEAGVQHWEAPAQTELHGLAWDDRTARLYFLATDDSGMWLGRIEPDGTATHLTEGAYITLSDLTARDGRLYFGSIASGYDEVQCYDLATGRQYRLSTSTYGSFSPSADGEGNVLMTTYDAEGYHAARQPIDTLHPVRPSRLPRNVVNPPRRKWPVANLDTVRFTAADSVSSAARHRARRYSRPLHLFKVHSWMPVAVNPFKIIDEHDIDVQLGVTLVSQNLLSSAESYLAYAWNHAEGSVVKGSLRYNGLGVELEAAGTYGGNQVIYAAGQAQPQPIPDKYYSLSAGATLPLVFAAGYRTRMLSLTAAWNFSNGLVANVGKLTYDEATHSFTNLQHIGYREGLHKLTFGIGYSNSVQLAHRDFITPRGYVLSASYALNPTNDHFSDLISVYGKLYTPGFAPHNSLTAAATYQTSIGGFKNPAGESFLSYKSARLIPRGFDSNDINSRNYFAASLDYQLPVWYPEGGIPSVLYFKRIRLNLGADYGQFDAFDYRKGRTETRRIHSFGGDLYVDFNVFRQPASATSTLRLSFYAPSKGGLWWSASLGLPF